MSHFVLLRTIPYITALDLTTMTDMAELDQNMTYI